MQWHYLQWALFYEQQVNKQISPAEQVNMVSVGSIVKLKILLCVFKVIVILSFILAVSEFKLRKDGRSDNSMLYQNVVRHTLKFILHYFLPTIYNNIHVFNYSQYWDDTMTFEPRFVINFSVLSLQTWRFPYDATCLSLFRIVTLNFSLLRRGYKILYEFHWHDRIINRS